MGDAGGKILKTSTAELRCRFCLCQFLPLPVALCLASSLGNQNFIPKSAPKWSASCWLLLLVKRAILSLSSAIGQFSRGEPSSCSQAWLCICFLFVTHLARFLFCSLGLVDLCRKIFVYCLSAPKLAEQQVIHGTLIKSECRRILAQLKDAH